jgi:WD40 repeat protein
LLASACIDETLIFSDTATGKTIQRMELGSPASSLSFHGDGLTCAVGTESGQVLVYDLRQPNDPIASYQAKDRVSSLRFAPDSTAITTLTMSRSRRATLSPENVTTNSTEQKDEIGCVVESVLNRSRDSMVASTSGKSVNEPHNVPPSTSLNKVCNRNEHKRCV